MRRSERKLSDPDLGVLCGQILFTFQDEVNTRLAHQGHEDIQQRHGAVFAYLDYEGTRATDLARRSGRPKQIIGLLVDELVDLGYVEREPDPVDRRAKLVVPTEKGRDAMRRADAIVRAIEARHAKAMGPDNYALFKAALAGVAQMQRERFRARLREAA
jgi:DNA-binding MarR family transcriptional regulator